MRITRVYVNGLLAMPLARYCEKRGHHGEPSLKAVFSWRDLDDDAETGKGMTFWMTRLETPG